MEKFTGPEEGQHGFALIGVIWLLLFAGSVTALLLLRASDRTVQTGRDGALVRGRLALDGAIEAIAAERLFGAADSAWLMAGAHTMDIDGVSVTGTLSAEEQRLDVNRADPQTIEGELQAAGVSRELRLQAIGRITARRAEGRIASLQELSALLSDTRREARYCLLDRLTVFGGQVQPVSRDMDAGQIIAPYALTRIELAVPSAGVVTAVFRSVPSGPTPIFILDWRTGRLCP